MKPMIALALLLTGTILGGQDRPKYAFEDANTGNGFLRQCSDLTPQTDSLRLWYCAGYVSGLIDGMAVVKAAVEYRGYCLPTKVETGQLADVLVKYIREHPEIAHAPTSVLLLKALIHAYPCRADLPR